MTRTDLDAWEDKQAKKRPRSKKSDGAGQQGVDFVTKLGAAKHALTIAEGIPDIADLIDNAEAIRAAARAMHISAPGVNAWMRFVIDAERKGWARIEELRESGALKTAKSGRPRGPGATNLMELGDLIEHRPTQRASEWSLLSKLTEFQLNELERVANEENRLITRAELLTLAKAGIPKSSEKQEKIRPSEDFEAITRAQDLAASEGFVGETIQIADDAKVNKAEKGWWVEAWVFIEDELTRSDIDQP